MTDTMDSIGPLLLRLHELGAATVKEENLFQIGGRGHFENPTTQLLEFFLNATRGHGFRTQILDALLDAAGVAPDMIDTKQEYWTRCEVVIDDQGGNGRLDLVVESASWIVVIENKIRHQAINDFDAYARWAEAKHKNPVLILLSIRNELAPYGWKVVRWLDLIRGIQKGLSQVDGGAGQGKWALFLNEFLNNVEIECARGRTMDQSRFEFATENAGALFQAHDLFQEFLQEIRSVWTVAIENHEGAQVRDSRIERLWQGKDNGGWKCVPIRFILDSPALEIVLKVFPSGRYGLNFYPGQVEGFTREHLRLGFPSALRIETERGYLACIVADSDNLSLPTALENAQNAISSLSALLAGRRPHEP